MISLLEKMRKPARLAGRNMLARWCAGALLALPLAGGTLLPNLAHAQETVCARVKIEIKQELTLERQAFDAEMKISNNLDTDALTEVGVVVKVTDEQGVPVLVSSDPNNTNAKFFIRVSNKQNISDVDGTGSVAQKTTAIINWLLIPAPGSAGSNPVGKKYLVGATLRYKFGSETQTLEVAPDVITVKPLPLLTLDYFLPQDVLADDPLTPEIEPVVPFTLGVRVKNNGFATAKNLKIDSAQPKIIENKQGLLINFKLTGSYVNDAPAQNTLLINFTDIAANTSKMGRWVMETSLAGKFTEFTAKFSHADELGGTLTSILQATNAHFLIRDVRVDLPGRDFVRDFLAKDGDVIRVYESDSTDTEVTDRSSAASFVADANGKYRLSFPATSGFAYVRLPDPFNGTKDLGTVLRSDAKQIPPENAWLSKTRNAQTKKWEYWINFFDVNTTGVYDSEFKAPSGENRPPVLQFIPDRVTKETKQVSFLVEASSPDGKPVTLSAAPLPSGARFTPQAQDPQAPTVARAIFDWTPAKGSAGNYPINFGVTDGTLSASRVANIKVEVEGPPPGPGVPEIVSPLPGAQVTGLKPALSVQTSTNAQDPSTQVVFEVYSDEAMTQQVATATVNKEGTANNPAPTAWSVPDALQDNTKYWWRARATDGSLFSAWVNGRFFVNTFNDAPDNFNLTSPAPNADVDSVTPTLAWTNSRDKDGDAINYQVTVYKNAGLTEVVAQSTDLAEDASGSTNWVVSPALSNHVKYYWRVIAKDALGATTASIARPFTVSTGNSAPGLPVILSPSVGGQSTNSSTQLVVQNAVDADKDLLTYVFEIDTVATFDSAEKKVSGQIIQGGNGSTSWDVTDLIENKRYYWRVKAQDGRAESGWVQGDFLLNAVNEAPAKPSIKNPGNGAWTANLQPSLEANPVTDPDGDAVRYEFEVYLDAGLTRKVTGGISNNNALIVPQALADKTTHYWRVRALDTQDLGSEWSSVAVLYVSSAPYQDPSIALTTPASSTVPDKDGSKKQVTLRWEGTDPNIEPNVALYYSSSKTGYNGTLIVDGLHQNAGTQTGSYVWDVTALPAGVYYVYAVIYDAKGTGKAYAPGSVVIPNETQSGTLKVAGPSVWYEAGSGSISVNWTGASGQNMVLPISGNAVLPGLSNLTLNAPKANGSTLASMILPYQCSKQAQLSPLQVGPVITEDINFAGRSASTPMGKVVYATSNTGDESLRVCEIRIVEERKISTTESEFTVAAKLSNLGAPLASAKATPVAVASGMSVSGELNFGNIGAGEVGNTPALIKVRGTPGANGAAAILMKGLKWTVQVVR